MATPFKPIAPAQLERNVFNLIGQDWMLITAGTLASFNTMTASWGGLGVLWNKNVCMIFVRPNRYTYEFLEKSARFTLSWFPEQYRDALTYCGSHSGRDSDKIKATGLTPVSDFSETVYFNEAKLVLQCRKLYYQDLTPKQFLEPSIASLYPAKDYHRMYIGEIEQCLTR